MAVAQYASVYGSSPTTGGACGSGGDDGGRGGDSGENVGLDGGRIGENSGNDGDNADADGGGGNDSGNDDDDDDDGHIIKALQAAITRAMGEGSSTEALGRARTFLDKLNKSREKRLQALSLLRSAITMREIELIHGALLLHRDLGLSTSSEEIEKAHQVLCARHFITHLVILTLTHPVTSYHHILS